MCLAIPGQIVTLEEDAGGLSAGRVRFGAIEREVCLAYTPDARVGDFVIVHVGFAIQRLDEDEARRTLAELEDLGK